MATLYEHANYKGWHVYLGPEETSSVCGQERGRMPCFQSDPDGVDHYDKCPMSHDVASSVKLEPGYGVDLYSDNNFEGGYRRFLSDVPSLGWGNQFEDVVSSVQVFRQCNHPLNVWHADCNDNYDQAKQCKRIDGQRCDDTNPGNQCFQGKSKACDEGYFRVQWGFDSNAACKKFCSGHKNACPAFKEKQCMLMLQNNEDISKDNLCIPDKEDYLKKYCISDEGIQKSVCKEYCGRKDTWEHCKDTVFRYCKGNTIKTDVWCRETLANEKAYGQNKVYMTEFCNGEGADMALCSCLNVEKIKADITKIPNITPVVVSGMVTEPQCYYQPCSGGATYRLEENHQCKPLYVCQNLIENLNIVGNSNMIKLNNNCGSDGATSVNKGNPSGSGTGTVSGSGSGTSSGTGTGTVEPQGTWEYIKSKAAYFGIGAGFLVSLCMMCCIACICLLLMMTSKGGRRR